MPVTRAAPAPSTHEESAGLASQLMSPISLKLQQRVILRMQLGPMDWSEFQLHVQGQCRLLRFSTSILELLLLALTHSWQQTSASNQCKRNFTMGSAVESACRWRPATTLLLLASKENAAEGILVDVVAALQRSNAGEDSDTFDT